MLAGSGGRMTTRKKILLCDDDDAVLKFLEPKLGQFYDVVTTNVPTRVLQLAQRERPDLIICDVDMPGIDGGDVAALLAKEPATRHIPFLFLTGLISPQEAKALDGTVANRPGVAKRAPLPELLGRIRELIG
jgi:CheY-like chemotaxis protein